MAFPILKAYCTRAKAQGYVWLGILARTGTHLSYSARGRRRAPAGVSTGHPHDNGRNKCVETREKLIHRTQQKLLSETKTRGALISRCIVRGKSMDLSLRGDFFAADGSNK